MKCFKCSTPRKQIQSEHLCLKFSCIKVYISSIKKGFKQICSAPMLLGIRTSLVDLMCEIRDRSYMC